MPIIRSSRLYLYYYRIWCGALVAGGQRSGAGQQLLMTGIYLLTPWCGVLLENLTGLQLVKKFPAFHRTRRFITALTSVHHLSLSWASPIQSIYPHPTSWRSILISTHLCLGLPNGLLPSSFPSKTLYTPLSSPIRATCPAHLILLDFITRTILGEKYKSFSWWWAYKCPKQLEQIISAITHSVASSWFSSLRLNSTTFFVNWDFITIFGAESLGKPPEPIVYHYTVSL